MGSASSPQPLVSVNNAAVHDNREPVTYHHQEHYLGILLRGGGSYRSGSVVMPSERPLFAFTPAGRADVNGLVGPTMSWYAGFTWPELVVSDDGGPEIGIELDGQRLSVPAFKVVDSEIAAQVTRRFALLRGALARPGLAGLMQARAVMLDIVTAYIDAPSGGSASHRAVVRFHELLRRRSCERVSIESLAESSGLTSDHLREQFHKRFGMRPVEYRTALRMARARELLSSSALKVGDIAAKVGYPDPLYFSRVFKQHFGMAPRDMIQRYRMIPSDP
ncbi:MAG: helix-turn-helix transcriptional regulator [Planctomycetes bacterium]|nr:helix-turn-helix transcriptional regulator [Planctomycetota bacterium]